MMNEKPKIVFAPGCFDNFDGTQEELNEFVKMLGDMVESGEIFEKAVPMTEESFNELPEEAQRQLTMGIDEIMKPRMLN
jgi:hypothetical protein